MMPETQTPGNTTLFGTAFESGAKKAGEGAVDRALNWVLDRMQDAYGGTKLLLGNGFRRYLNNAFHRYNQVRTLATGLMNRKIIGQDSIYVSIGVEHEGRVIDTCTVEPMLRVSNNILIQGTGGIGKSMLMRYLFLNSVNRGEYIPVLLELRRIGNQESGKLSILDLIYSCMEEYDVELPRDSFEYSLRLGKYLFLLDGFDEIKEQYAAEAAEEIQRFCAKYPKNACIVTSRPNRDVFPLETFTPVKSLPLNKQQAVHLASIIWKEDEKTREFCRQLEVELFEKHKDFAENPLLLSMMFLTFMRNSSIPDHLAEFYAKAFEALYSTHDGNDKGAFHREFKCITLDETRFRRLLSHFCFQTFFKDVYEFTRSEILGYLSSSITKLGYSDVSAVYFLMDLRNVVCMIVEDGGVYRFAHRSFQSYFAACYTAEVLNDQQQKLLFSKCLQDPDALWRNRDYYRIMDQLARERFLVNAFEDQTRAVCTLAEQDDSYHRTFICYMIEELAASMDSKVLVYSPNRPHGYLYVHSMDFLFECIGGGRPSLSDEEREQFWKLLRRIITNNDEEIIVGAIADRYIRIRINKVDSSDALNAEEKNVFFELLYRYLGYDVRLQEINEWLRKIDNKRQSLEMDDFIDNL